MEGATPSSPRRKEYRYIACLNGAPAFIKALADLCAEHMQGGPWNVRKPLCGPRRPRRRGSARGAGAEPRTRCAAAPRARRALRVRRMCSQRQGVALT